MTITVFRKENLKEMLLCLKQPIIANNCRISATSDIEAMECWLKEYFDKPTTFRTYKKEAERFLVWCATVRGTNFSHLNRQDVDAYIQFLKNPTPKELWCGPRRQKKDQMKRWYPFAKPLSESAIITALASLNSMMSYLIDANYLDFNPFILVRQKSRFRKKIDEQNFSVQERILGEKEWLEFLKTIEEEPEDNELNKFKKNRLDLLIKILFFLGLRIDEMAKATWADCKNINGKWWFFVRGKGDRLGKIPINTQLLQAIMNYRHISNKTLLPDNDEYLPIIETFKGSAISVRQISNLIKAIALKTAEKFDAGSCSQKKLLKFSPHWLRHLSASRQDLAGISFTNIKNNLRHQNEQTTRIYVHAYDDERHREMEKLKLS
jgi:integrase